jgi:hypothetical protein
MMWDTEAILSGVLMLVAMLGYSRLMPTPVTPRIHWLPRSLLAGGVAAACALSAAILWDGRGGSDHERVWSLLSSVGPYVLGGWLVLAAGTYLKVYLWSVKNRGLDSWPSRHE